MVHKTEVDPTQQAIEPNVDPAKSQEALPQIDGKPIAEVVSTVRQLSRHEVLDDAGQERWRTES